MGDKDDDTTAQQATLAVLSCFQKLSDVNLENYEKLKAEFEDVMKTQLPKTGSQMEVLKGEADRVFGYARQYIEQIRGGGKEKGGDKEEKDKDKDKPDQDTAKRKD